jgi:uncharacterized membrane protein YdfJ with MMPL/SSD domain
MSVKPAGGIAARAGRWSARHKKTAIIGWFALVALSLVFGGSVVREEPTTAQQYNGESRAAEEIREEAGFPKQDKPIETVLVQSKQHTVDDPAFKAAVGDLERAVKGQPLVKSVDSPYGEAPIVSHDGHSALIEFELKGKDTEAVDKIAPVMAAVDKAAAGHTEVTAEQFGAASIAKQLADTEGKDFKKVEQLSLPITALILLIAFGALVAASVPLVLALTAIAATLGLLGLASRLVPLDGNADALIFLIGLAVGVDYSLFYVRREREERAKGHGKLDAIEIAAATSGRAVLISGITVIIAMAGMFITDNTTFMGMGMGTILVVAVAVLGSLTVLPAMLAALGDKVNRGRLPFVGRKNKGEVKNSRAWGWVVDRVMRRPVVAIVVAGGALIALSIPALGMQTKLSGYDEMPKVSTVQALLETKEAFPAEADPASVVVKAANIDAPHVKAAIADFKAAAGSDEQIVGEITTEINPGHTVAVLDVGLPGTGTDEASQNALSHLREDIIPSTLGTAKGVEANVTGNAAGNADFNTLMSTKTPLVFAFVLGFAFLLLLISFRSIVIAFKAIVLNLLAVGASYGLLTLVFQDGHGEKLLGFESNGGIGSWLPLFLFVILFGLSMDYHVFMISRIREAWQRGMKTEEAVSHGIKSTAGTITSAAVVMVSSFAVFTFLDSMEMKELGVGLSFAILLDATIIRGVLLPATMKLLGDWNWYVPRWLEWLPEMDHGAGTDPEPKERPQRGHGIPVPAPSPA